ncbi:hypothetical protein [Sphingomonas rubra]|uniref:Uncharacterized protein n=1 Tax=Sphingomonas rubra TaxID=634430 RepID=A0A1I5STV2_9SPHN|nr:hypothetical protein [Sphingomonas rubra]SFP74190.1 hypothetical protein SAMN04488241_106143 [Sphingomonas rubra]
MHVLVFYALLLVACGHAAWRGGAPERIVAATLMAGTVATWIVAIGVGGSRTGHFYHVEIGVLLVDAAMLAVLLAVALAADRFWPLWLTAIHSFGVVGHVAKAIDPAILSNVYQAAHSLTAYPGLILLILATRRHRRRLARTGCDPSWSISWPWSTAATRARLPTG